jgi:RHS repeat-associated protein
LRVDQRTTSWNSRYTFSAKEKDEESGYGYFGARYYDSDLSIWLSVDPMSDKYPSFSPYCYTVNNPLILVDPNGCDVEVVLNERGTYTITGGTLNSDKNIYVMKDGQRTGEILGQSLTEHSFFGDDGNVVKDAVINTKDQSGQKFLDNLKTDDPNIISYALNARNNQKYDFKAQGEDNTLNHYRGMPLKDANSNTVYGSARDVGNYGAGYVAGRNGLSWGGARLGFDAYQSFKDGSLRQGNWSTEGMPTQSAQRIGFEAGSKQRSRTHPMSISPWGGLHH